MEYNTTQPTAKVGIETFEAQQDTIFTEAEFSPGQYDRHIRHARNAIFALGILMVLAGFFEAAELSGTAYYLVLGIDCAIALVFFLLGFWTRKKPYYAIVTALVLFIGLIILGATQDPISIIKGWYIKIIVFVFLFKGLSDAREAQNMKKTLGN